MTRAESVTVKKLDCAIDSTWVEKAAQSRGRQFFGIPNSAAKSWLSA